jgi:hypothetical protein
LRFDQNLDLSVKETSLTASAQALCQKHFINKFIIKTKPKQQLSNATKGLAHLGKDSRKMTNYPKNATQAQKLVRH